MEIEAKSDWIYTIKMGYWKGEPWTIVVLEGAPENQKAYVRGLERLDIWPVIWEEKLVAHIRESEGAV